MTPTVTLLLVLFGASLLGLLIQSARLGKAQADRDRALVEKLAYKDELYRVKADIEVRDLSLEEVAARLKKRLEIE